MKNTQCMDILITNMSGYLNGTIKWELRKTTQMSLVRFLKLLAQQLTSRVEGTIEFQPLPNTMDLYNGQVSRAVQTPLSHINVNFKLSCTRQTNLEGGTHGHIALVGRATLGTMTLSCSMTLMEGFQWITREDLGQIKWQELNLKIPPTHIHLVTLVGDVYRLTYFQSLAKWETYESITLNMETILKKGGLLVPNNGANARNLQNLPNYHEPSQPS